VNDESYQSDETPHFANSVEHTVGFESLLYSRDELTRAAMPLLSKEWDGD
jgi:hypothetical protein